MKTISKIVSFPLFVVAARFIPWERIPSTCVFWHVTGLPCPTCGITRSAVALSHLDFPRSVTMHPFGIPAVGLFALWWVLSLHEIVAGKPVGILRWAHGRSALLAMIGFLLMIVFGVFRIWLIVRGV